MRKLMVMVVLFFAMYASHGGEYTVVVKDSDDFAKHQAAFETAAKNLVESRRCTVAQLKESGGFWKSMNHKNKPIYFTYCGAAHISNRIYLDASTGRIFQ